MARKKVDSIRVAGRLSENNMSEEELEFVKEQLKNQSASQFVRQAIKVYRMYLEGEIFRKVFKGLEELESQKLSEKEGKEEYNELDEVISSGFFGE